uniref:Uncharacterized protein n=1 Tax=Arundo donax TaxID=35708 RepID=A0A0A9CHC1_ARUDO
MIGTVANTSGPKRSQAFQVIGNYNMAFLICV